MTAVVKKSSMLLTELVLASITLTVPPFFIPATEVCSLLSSIDLEFVILPELFFFYFIFVDNAHFESWSTAGCAGTSNDGGDFTPDKCFNQENAGYILSTSFSCASSYVPAGSWYSSLMYTDSGCGDMYMASQLKNKYCMNLGGYSMKIDYPSEYYYTTSSDCSSTPMKMDISSTANVCFPSDTGTTTKAMKYTFLQG
jgi:hypothetical protein